jgi:hypothetical protein
LGALEGSGSSSSSCDYDILQCVCCSQAGVPAAAAWVLVVVLPIAKRQQAGGKLLQVLWHMPPFMTLHCVPW